jgi:uncharacterized membrane protein YgdD (TMEM256/DUF423 family)
MHNELPVVQPTARSSCCAGLWLLLAGLLGASGVAMGAYEAHNLEALLTRWGLPAEEIAGRLHNCEVAVRYQMYHAVAYLGLAVAGKTIGGRSLQVAGVAWLLGILLFSGILYMLVFTGNRSMVHLIPIGGLLLIIGWLAVAIGACLATSSKQTA